MLDNGIVPMPLQVFCKVLELSSFRKAALQLGVPLATASHQINALEKRLGVNLLLRSTRHVEATAEGLAFYQRSAPLLQGIVEAQNLLQSASRAPAGQLNVGAPASVVRTIMAPALVQFFSAYPDIRLRFVATDKVLSFDDEGLDCLIRVGPPNSDGLMVRSLGQMPQFFAANPDLIARFGMPCSLAEMAKFPFVNYGVRRQVGIASIEAYQDKKKEIFEASAVVSVDDGGSYVAFAIQGLGAIQAPMHDLDRHLRSGKLQLLLPEWQGPTLPIFAIFARGRHLLPRCRVFVDWFEATLLTQSLRP